MKRNPSSRGSRKAGRNHAPGLPRKTGRRDSGLWWGVLGVCVLLAGAGFWLTWGLRQPSAPGNTVGVATFGPETPSPGPGASGRESLVVDRINRANQMVAQGEFENAVELLKEAGKASPDDEDVHYNLGIALARLGRNEEAVNAYEAALRIFPDYAEAHNNLGNLLLRMGQHVEALKHFEQAVKITPEYASAWNNFGTALRQMGRTNEAFGYFQEAVRLNTNYWQARFNLATSHFEEGRLDEARAEFEAVLRLEPEFAPARLALTQLDRGAESTPGLP